MKNLIQLKKSRVVRPMWLAASAAVVVAAAAGIAAGQGSAAPHEFKGTSLENGVLTVTGTNASDNIALRLQAGQPGTLQVDLGDDGAAVAKIALDGGNSGDRLRIDESNGVFGDTVPTTIDGGNGNDELFGGAGAETLLGGNGNDLLAGGGAGTLNGGNGEDTLAGGPGAETLVGGNGEDTMVFNGAAVARHVDLSANGNRLRFFRDVANVTMDTNGVERVDFNALAGADVVTVNDLTGTDVNEVNVDL